MKSHLLRILWFCFIAITLNTSFAWSQAQTFLVDTIDDTVDDTDNLQSLREAILAANTNVSDGDIIQFDAALDGQTITLLLGEIAIEDDLVIGNDISPVSILIDAGGASRIFSISSMNASGNREVSLFDLSFLNGMGDNGGALFIDEGEVVGCVRCVFDGNVATGDMPGQGGGAIFNAGALSLMYTDVVNNSAVTGSGNGGGILIAPGGSLDMAAGTFDGNVANRAGGAVENNDGTASFEGILFSNNIAGPDSMSAAPGNGGAIHVSGMGETMIQGGVATGNKAFSEGGAFWNGAGVMTVDGVTIGGRGTGEPNVASGPAADNGGGGLFNIGGTLNVSNAIILANVADGASGSGGGILTDGGVLSVTSSTLLWNNASRAGGGIESTNGAEVTLVDVDFSQNMTGPAPGNGAAIHVTGAGNTMVTGGVITTNRAASEGGGFWNGSGTMTLEGTQFGGSSPVDANIASGDNADNGGGGLFNNGGTMIANNILVNWNRADGASGSGGGILSDGGSLMVTNSVIQGNSSNRAGGGVESTGGASLTLENVTFISNETGDAPGNGGAVHVTGTGNTVIKGGAAIGNSAASEGGAFWNGSGTMTIDGTVIGGENEGNVANGDDADNGGGGVFGINGTLVIKNAWIEGNIAGGASGSGGGVLNDGGALQMDSTVVKGNIANRAGGGVESNGAPDADGTIRTTSDVLRYVTLQDNAAGTAPGNGGGFHLTGPGNVQFVQSVAVNNAAGNEGGGLWNSGAGAMSLLNATVSGNSAPKGGGLFQQAGENSTFTTWYSTIARNIASTSGGGFQSDGGMPELFNTILAENTRDGVASDCVGDFSTLGYNLIETLEGCVLTPEPTDVIGQSAMLQDLSDNGGPTFTHGLMNGSAVIDAGRCDPAVMVDQRGAPRIVPCDIGAFESVGMPPQDNGITFTLIDAATDMPVSGFDPIPNGVNIVHADLPMQLNIRANVPENTKSVMFGFDGNPNFRTEHVFPYALFGDVDGDYAAQPLVDGLHKITATPYTMPEGAGQKMMSGSVSFNIVSSSNVVTRFVLVDADTDQDVMVLLDGIMISITDLPDNLNVRAETGSETRSVTFSAASQSRSEVVPPFALFGDISGDYVNGTVPPGSYVLTATPFAGSPGLSREGVSLTLRATVTDESAGMNVQGGMTLPANEYAVLSNDPSEAPVDFALRGNYPNPFNPATAISFSVPQLARVKLAVFNVLGQHVQTLVDGEMPAGTHQVSFEAGNFPSGIYLYRLDTPQGTFTRKMTLVK